MIAKKIAEKMRSIRGLALLTIDIVGNYVERTKKERKKKKGKENIYGDVGFLLKAMHHC